MGTKAAHEVVAKASVRTCAPGTCVDSASNAISGVDSSLAKTDKFLSDLGSDKFGDDLLPTVISMRELIESFDKRSDKLIADTRRMINDLSQSITKNEPKRGPRR